MAVTSLAIPAPDPETGPPYRSHVVVDAAFDPEECAAIIDLAGAWTPEASTVGADDDGIEVDSIRAATTRWLPVDDDAIVWITERIAAVVEHANASWGLDLVGFAEDLQFTTYDRVGDFYTWHQDGLDGGVSDRKLAVVVQLSDPADYDGGGLELFDVLVDLDAEALSEWRERVRAIGTAVVFPSWEYHRVTELTGGVRHSLVSWISGPRVR